MSIIRICDKCDQRIDFEGILGDRSWVQVGVELDGQVSDGGTRKDYHRDCARDVTIAEAWASKGLIPL